MTLKRKEKFKKSLKKKSWAQARDMLVCLSCAFYLFIFGKEIGFSSFFLNETDIIF